MSYFVSQYPHGTFSWADITSTDFPKTKTFLEQLFNWTSVDMPTGKGKPPYTMFYLDGKQVAGGSPGWIEGLPSMWSNYINVDDTYAATEKAAALGAKVVAPPMQVLESGHMSMITDPQGANVGLWQPLKHIGAQVVNTVGAMCWNELYVPDSKKAQEFYGQLFNWTFETDETGYTTIKNDNRMNGGIFQMTEGMVSMMPPCWMPYFTVANLKESVAKAKELGGRVYMEEKEIGLGKIATVAEPTGAGMILMEMSVEPEHWTE